MSRSLGSGRRECVSQSAAPPPGESTLDHDGAWELFEGKVAIKFSGLLRAWLEDEGPDPDDDDFAVNVLSEILDLIDTRQIVVEYDKILGMTDSAASAGASAGGSAPGAASRTTTSGDAQGATAADPRA